MKQYLDLVKYVLENGEERKSRSGDTLSAFGLQFRHNLQDCFPLLTTKKVPFRIVAEELKFFLGGKHNLKDLLNVNVNIWNSDGYRYFKAKNPNSTLTFDEYIETIRNSEEYLEIGELDRLYGVQWRDWINKDGKHVNQIKYVIDQIKNNPTSRRILWTGWNAGELNKMVLNPCHVQYQFYVSNDKKLSLHMYQRSGDLFLGVPFNIASCALLTHLIAAHCELEVGELIISFGDVHIYKNLIEQCKLQLTREPRQLPTINLNQDVKSLEDISEFDVDKIEILNYNPHSAIKGKLSVGEGV